MMTSTIENATYIENVVEQEADQPDWVEVRDTTVSFKPKEIHILEDSTNTVFTTLQEVKMSDQLLVVDNNNEFYSTYPYSISVQNAYDSLDPLSDGSGAALWMFDGDPLEVSGTYNGTWVGNPSYVSGKIGQAASFDGRSGILIPPIEFTDFTIMGWVYQIGGYYRYWKTIFSSSTDEHIMLCIYKDKLICYQNGTKFVSNTIPVDQWIHVALTYVGGKATLYINGEVDPNVNNISVSLDREIAAIGADYVARSNSINDEFIGYIDQVRVFNRGLNANEIQQIMNGVSKYYVDIHQLNLPYTPKKVFFNQYINLYITLEETPERCISLNENIYIQSSSSNSITSNIDLSSKLKIGDKLVVNNTPVTVSGFSTTNITNDTVTFDDIGEVVTSAYIPDRSIQINEIDRVYDETNNRFNLTFENFAQQGRAIQRKIVARYPGTEVYEPLVSQLYMAQ